MKLALSATSNLPSMMQIVSDAQNYLAELGIDQWQNGYPNEEVLLNDISNTESYCVSDDEGQIMGMTMFTNRPEPTYNSIDGSWLTADDAAYGVIHRLAVSNRFRSHGVAKFIFEQCEAQLKANKVPSMRIDTHEENKGMQKLISQLGYEYCGVILLENGDKRLAYEKVF
jgi:ribosomal protein S18 acetylase RimI-like enzyme